MCLEHQCPDKYKCYRYTVLSNKYWQSYFMHDPREGDKTPGKCPEFIDDKNRSIYGK